MANEIVHKRVQEVKNDILVEVESMTLLERENIIVVFNMKFKLGCYARL